MKLVVFVLRGCGVGWLGAYGNEWVVTPALDRLAAEGVVFDRHIAETPDIDAARAVWRTLRGHGIFTAYVRANRESNDAHPDYYAAWDKVFDARSVAGEASLPLVHVVPGIREELASHADWLLVVELDTLLPPWVMPAGVFEAYAEELDGDEPPPWPDPPVGPFDATDLAAWDRLRCSFAAVVTKLDAELEGAFERFADAVCVVTADAGFPLGEHGRIGPHRLHEELVHLPLIVRFPDRAFAGTRVNGFTQPPDLAPTILGVFQKPIPDGRDLSPLWAGAADAIRPHAITRIANEVAIRTDEWACLMPTASTDEPQAAMLFVKPDDRAEVNDVAARRPEVVAELAALTSPR